MVVLEEEVEKVDKEKEKKRTRRRRRRRHVFLYFVCFFFFVVSDKQNKRRWGRELQISELMTCAYAAVCTRRENVGYFVSTDYYCCIFIFTELDILKRLALQ